MDPLQNIEGELPHTVGILVSHCLKQTLLEFMSSQSQNRS